MRPPKKATGAISLIFLWHESNRPEVVVGAVAVGPIMCAGDRNILTRPLTPSIFVNVLNFFLCRRLNKNNFFCCFKFFFSFLSFSKKIFRLDFCDFLCFSLPITWLCARDFSCYLHTSANSFTFHVIFLFWRCKQSSKKLFLTKPFPSNCKRIKKIFAIFLNIFKLEARRKKIVRETISIRQSILFGSFFLTF